MVKKIIIFSSKIFLNISFDETFFNVYSSNFINNQLNMKTKIFALMIAGSFFYCSAFSQTVKENIDKAAKDKNTMDRSAKADVLIQKKIIFDSSSQTKKTTQKIIPSAAAVKKTKSKKGKYKKKYKTS